MTDLVVADINGAYPSLGLCPATVEVDNYGDSAKHPHVLICNLPENHDGKLHYDHIDDISWKEGLP